MAKRATCMGKALGFNLHEGTLYLLTKYYRWVKVIIACFVQKTQNIVQK